MANPERWHRIVVSGAEIAAIGDLLDHALTQNHKAGLERIATLREAGFSGALQDTQIEVHVLGDALYLNDGALRLYRTLDGDKAVDGTLNSLPNDPSCGSLIHNVWREIQRP